MYKRQPQRCGEAENACQKWYRSHRVSGPAELLKRVAELSLSQKPRNETEEPIVNNFELCIPTKMIFGRDTHKQVGEQVKQYANKVLLHYGGGSIKRSGLYDEVVASLKDCLLYTSRCV